MGLLRATPGALRLLGWRRAEGVKAKSDRGIFPESKSHDLRKIAEDKAQRRTMMVGTSLCRHVDRFRTELPRELKENAYDVTPVSTIFSATVVRPRR